MDGWGGWVIARVFPTTLEYTGANSYVLGYFRPGARNDGLATYGGGRGEEIWDNRVAGSIWSKVEKRIVTVQQRYSRYSSYNWKGYRLYITVCSR